jgi:hypothetical protein
MIQSQAKDSNAVKEVLIVPRKENLQPDRSPEVKRSSALRIPSTSAQDKP